MNRIIHLIFLFIFTYLFNTELLLSTSNEEDDACELHKTIKRTPNFLIPVNFTTEKPITVLISCIDCRLRDETVVLMNSLNLRNKYYEIAIPGASLAISGSHLFFLEEEGRKEYTHLSKAALSEREQNV